MNMRKQVADGHTVLATAARLAHERRQADLLATLMLILAKVEAGES